MGQIPGTEGPVSYPNTPEGGVEGGAPGYTPLPGGTNLPEQPHPDFMPTPAMGAGTPGWGGLTPNPGEPADGSVRKGWKGDAYATAAPPVVPASGGLSEAREVSGDPNGGTDGIEVPDTFTPL